MTDEPMTHAKPERCGVIAVVGAPNAGKSTLVNALVGQKVAITSPKAQTTRTRVMGVALEYGKLGRLTLESDFERFHELVRAPR